MVYSQIISTGGGEGVKRGEGEEEAEEEADESELWGEGRNVTS